MTNEQNATLSKKIIERVKTCETGVIAAGAHPRIPGAGAGVALVAPDCILYTYTPDSGTFFDLCLN